MTSVSTESHPLRVLPQDYGCPDWCERWDHHADVVDETNLPVHYGPQFGAVWVDSRGDEYYVRVCEEALKDLTPTRARKLAADAVAAADWAEAARRGAGNPEASA